jgi:hypothetical protein
LSLDDLKAPKKPRTCVACKAFVAECMAPVGEGSAAMCWLCAHHVVDHDVSLHEAAEARCECTPDQIYPERVIKERAAQLANAELGGFTPISGPIRFEHGDGMPKMHHPDDWKSGHFYNPTTKTMDTNIRGEVVASFDLNDRLVRSRKR